MARSIGRGDWHGRWYADGRRVKRKLGPVRPPGTRDGLTRAQVEREIRRRIETELPTPAVGARLTVREVGERLLAHLEGLGRKAVDAAGLRVVPARAPGAFFGDRPLARIEPKDIEAFIAAGRRNGSR